MEDGFVRRATQVERLLHDDRTAFVVVSTLEPAPAREARFLTDELRRRGMPLGAMVLNRTLPVAVRQPAVAKAAKALRGVDAATLSEVSSAVGAPASGVAAVLDGIAEHFGDLVVAAGREAERRAELEAVSPLTAVVPTLPGDVHDLGALLAIGAHLTTR
jgi:anion-transporting  ArsA/GET3 family ATPase